MISDPIVAGIEAGWRISDARQLEQPQALQADVVIIGSGAGGAVAADLLSAANLDVIIVEAGPLRSSRDHALDEAEAYEQLYQENSTRTTRDGNIRLLQGRGAGGGTAISWTASFEPPEAAMQRWAAESGIAWCQTDELRSWLQLVRKRHAVGPWRGQRNANNTLLADGCERLGWRWDDNERSVRGCWNLGYCALGCPTNASRSGLLTGLSDSLRRGAHLLVHSQASRLRFHGDRVFELECMAVHSNGNPAHSLPIRINAQHYVLASGAIDGAALLLRSGAPDPYRRTGHGCFLQPSVLSIADFKDQVAAYHGAPQVTYTDQFLQPDQNSRLAGFLIQPLPLHPMFAAGVLPGHAEAHAALMNRLPFLSALAGQLHDGAQPRFPGGRLSLSEDGQPLLDYSLQPEHWETFRAAWLAMAEIQFAAGARSVLPAHIDARPYGSYSEARRGIQELSLSAERARIGSAYVTGGCAMGVDPAHSLVNPEGRHHHIANLSVFDGSVFPTGIGVPPQLTIQAVSARNAARLAATLGGSQQPVA